MESYFQITQINDFLFCPRSIYFHNVFANTVSEEIYHQVPQKKGQHAHISVDTNTYSSHKNIITGLFVYSEKYSLVGRIDTLDTSTHTLTERKYSVTKLYDGFIFQLYAQYFALLEMGYTVNNLRLYSKKDNKNYIVELPNNLEILRFEQTLEAIHTFTLEKLTSQNINKCRKCIYNNLCDIYEEE